VAVALVARVDRFFVAQDTVFDHFLQRAGDSVAVAEMRPGWPHMAASVLDNNHFALLASYSPVHLLLLHHLAYIPGKMEGIQAVVLGEVAAAHLREVHTFVRSLFVS
jgi:hypothetical protein